MNVWLYACIIIFVVAAVVVQFVLISLKIDHDLTLSHRAVALPALIAYGAAILFFLTESIVWFVGKARAFYGFGLLAIVVLFAGAFWTTLLLVRKFDVLAQTTYIVAFLPFLIGLVLSGVLFLVGMIQTHRYTKTRAHERTSM